MAYNDRPPGVTFVAVIAWVTGILQVGISALVLTGAIRPAGVSVPSAWVGIVVGIITLLVSFGLFGARRVARVIVTASLVLSILSAILQAIAHQDANVLVGAVLTIALAVLGIALLYTSRANRFFA
ncbi:MAG: hypothetical protein BGO45_07065 [Microbacterium sp. 71-36]|uniref:hypothetical protein n=1 Tax=unclassified Microbacterium TaxID=2609290 RepID=UPI00086E12AD|nr:MULTISPECIES: hypothetical protein [unclassified Microbacterium]MBN9211586.1 hypothetical protein [Microbacterium sp.]ODT38131.1 MAG: hypothetical protein ABS60_11260 [Microbacterium sp. SCN 71-17]ODU49989.1 MAG: hypothetical protein ABT07_03855 [Microbacterium sp. SCN 70-10]OJV75430.1 MAG: hypothetical protein BGO45_07065 [Microbacterium sp. 71-36]